MNASKLRLVLVGCIVAIISGVSVGAWWLQDYLAERVTETDKARIDAEVSAEEVLQLKKLDQELAEQESTIERTKQVAAAPSTYQAQMITDITAYAARYSIGISSFDFSSGATGPAQQSANGVQKIPFVVNLNGPLDYVTFLRFLRDIEKNLTRVHLTSLSLAPDRDPRNITNPVLNLEVYVKK